MITNNSKTKIWVFQLFIEHDIGEDIKRVLESGSYSKHIRVPKSIQDYFKMQEMIHKEVSDHIQKIETE